MKPDVGLNVSIEQMITGFCFSPDALLWFWAF